jgi:hypothetical protein
MWSWCIHLHPHAFNYCSWLRSPEGGQLRSSPSPSKSEPHPISLTLDSNHPPQNTSAQPHPSLSSSFCHPHQLKPPPSLALWGGSQSLPCESFFKWWDCWACCHCFLSWLVADDFFLHWTSWHHFLTHEVAGWLAIVLYTDWSYCSFSCRWTSGNHSIRWSPCDRFLRTKHVRNATPISSCQSIRLTNHFIHSKPLAVATSAFLAQIVSQSFHSPIDQLRILSLIVFLSLIVLRSPCNRFWTCKPLNNCCTDATSSRQFHSFKFFSSSLALIISRSFQSTIGQLSILSLPWLSCDRLAIILHANRLAIVFGHVSLLH